MQRVRAENVDERSVICIVLMFHSSLKWSLNCQKSAFFAFCNFVFTFAKNPSLLKQFTYMHLKVLSTLFWKYYGLYEILLVH